MGVFDKNRLTIKDLLSDDARMDVEVLNYVSHTYFPKFFEAYFPGTPPDKSDINRTIKQIIGDMSPDDGDLANQLTGWVKDNVTKKMKWDIRPSVASSKHMLDIVIMDSAIPIIRVSISGWSEFDMTKLSKGHDRIICYVDAKEKGVI